MPYPLKLPIPLRYKSKINPQLVVKKIKIKMEFKAGMGYLR